MSDSRSSSPDRGRLVAAAGLVVGVLCWIASAAVSPAWADDTAGYVAEIAASPTAHVASGILFLAGAFAILPGLVAVARLLRGPRGIVGRAGAWMVAAGALAGGGMGLAVNVYEATIARADLTQAQMVALADASEESAGAMVAFVVVFFGGFVLGLVLLGVGLALRRLHVPAALVLVTVVLLFAAGETRIGSVIGISVLGVAVVLLARRLLTVPQARWESPEPLEAGPGGETTERQLQPA